MGWDQDIYRNEPEVLENLLSSTPQEGLTIPPNPELVLSVRRWKSCGLGAQTVFSYKYPLDGSNALSQNLNAVRFHPTEWFLK